MRQGVLEARLRRDRFFQLGVFFVSVVVIAAVFAPWLAPHNPITGDLKNAYLVEPGSRFLLGTDTQGRDVLSRVLYGARLSLSVGVISQSVSVTLGVLLGLLAGYYGRWVDALVMRLADITLAFPTLLLLIAVAAAVKPSLPVVFVVIGIVGWAAMARLVRSQVLVLRPDSAATSPAQCAHPGDHRRNARHRGRHHG
jgi:peptide/nickel transport system permease protein